MNARAIGSAVTAVVVLAAAITGCASLRRKNPEDVVAERQHCPTRPSAFRPSSRNEAARRAGGGRPATSRVLESGLA